MPTVSTDPGKERSALSIHRNARTKETCFPMSQNREMNSKGKQVAVVVGATSKWQSNGRNTLLAHGRILDDSGLPVGAR